MSSIRKAATRSAGFAPLARRDARILILGSLPGQKSLAETQYYAHQRNAFWPIMRELADADGTYMQRCVALLERKIAVWDVLARSVRPGSLDADIDLETAEVNNFEAFFAAHPDIVHVCFNGQTAARIYRQRVHCAAFPQDLRTLPSTSPAYAAMNFDQKLELWRVGIGLNEHHA